MASKFIGDHSGDGSLLTNVTAVDSDKLDGMQPSTGASANTIVQRDSNGDTSLRVLNMTNEIRVPANTSVTDPSITCTTDGDTGINFNGANQIDLVVGSANRVTVDGSKTTIHNELHAQRMYDSNDPTYFVDPAGTSYFNQIDGLNFKAKHLETIGLGNSYDERVILLCPKIDTNTSLDNHVHGKIMMRKTGGNVVDFFDVYVNCVYNDNRAVMHSMGQRNNHKFVTCTYNGITWVAIKVGYTANPYNEAWFQGFADTSYSTQAKADQLRVVSYYDTQNGGTVLNSEIYNSIADYTPNGLAFKSTASSNNFDGPITSAADITAYSDARLKSDVVTIEGALDKVSALRGVDYIKDGKPSTGVIAQEVEAVKPELVHTADDEIGTKSVAYGNMAGLFIEAIKELKDEVASLKAEIAELKK